MAPHVSTAGGPAAKRARFPAMSYPGFRVFLLGQFMSLVGTWMQNTVLPYLAYRITGQPIYLGLVAFAGTLPSLLLTLPAGVWVEHLDKRKTVIAMQAVMMVQAFLLAALALAGVINIWHIIVLALVLGSANAIEITARQTMQSELVGREAIPSAIALNGAAFNLARVIGPSLSAPFLLLMADGGEGWAFAANGVSYLFVIIGLLILPLLSKGRTMDADNEAPAPKSAAMDAFREGQRFIRNHGLAQMVIIMAAVLGFIGWPAVQQIPVFARDVLGQVGDLEAAVAARNSLLVTAQGVGALVASILLSWFAHAKRKGLWMILGQITFALSILGMAFSRSLPLSAGLMVLGGWGMVTQNNNANQILQITVPRAYRARVFSTYLFALQGVTPFGSLVAGVIAQYYGAPAVALLSGVACLTVAIGGNLLSSRLRDYRLEDPVA